MGLRHKLVRVVDIMWRDSLTSPHQEMYISSPEGLAAGKAVVGKPFAVEDPRISGE